MKLPFHDRWFVASAGDTINVNHHMAVRAQWYGVDFVKVSGPTGRSLKSGPGEQLTDHYSWDAEVLSPVSGLVVHTLDGLPDNPIGTKDEDQIAGNYVVIETADHSFVFLAHFKRSSISVRQGQSVTIGDTLGRCGNSGNSTMPHIHLHLQDTPTFNQGQGLNPIFTGIDVELTGKKFENVDWPLIKGLFVSNHPAAKSSSPRTSVTTRSF